ncbi:hypothetical protein E2C01_047863 [Portunus trituberculatus]|uniref:Uncharacterized protein n=1 Tax=Portunus trituberculatus TaxID=210409 RepID=A0A5B7G9Z7_PORTR|nr:hypothetical protein [Portunus trituberculatus]
MSRHTRLSPRVQRPRQRHKGCQVTKVPCSTPLPPRSATLPHIPPPDRHTCPEPAGRTVWAVAPGGAEMLRAEGFCTAQEPKINRTIEKLF